MAALAEELARGARKAEGTERGGSSSSFLGIVRPAARLQPARAGLQPGTVPTEGAARPGGPAGEDAKEPGRGGERSKMPSLLVRKAATRSVGPGAPGEPCRSLPRASGEAAAPSGAPGIREGPARAAAKPPSQMRAGRWATL